MTYKIQVFNFMDPGQRKDANGNPHQEDCIFPALGKATDSDRLFILCDGMGGHDAGEVASSTVCSAMSQSILQAQTNAEGDFTPQDLNDALDSAFDALDLKDTGAKKKMGTTMTMLKLYKQGAVIAHMGDSRVYHFRPGPTAKDTKVLYRTWDHSLVNDFIRAGIMDAEEAKTSSQKNVITRAMQPHVEHRPGPTIFKTRNICPGDYFYLCSDGMLENMDIPELCHIFSHEGGNDATKLNSLAVATRNNRDNHSAIIVRIVDVDKSDADTLDDFDMEYSAPAPECVPNMDSYFNEPAEITDNNVLNSRKARAEASANDQGQFAAAHKPNSNGNHSADAEITDPNVNKPKSTTATIVVLLIAILAIIAALYYVFINPAS